MQGMLIGSFVYIYRYLFHFGASQSCTVITLLTLPPVHCSCGILFGILQSIENLLVVEIGATGASGQRIGQKIAEFQYPGQRFQPPTKVDSVMQTVHQRFDQPKELKKECESDNGINSVFDQLCEVTNYGDILVMSVLRRN